MARDMYRRESWRTSGVNAQPMFTPEVRQLSRLYMSRAKDITLDNVGRPPPTSVTSLSRPASLRVSGGSSTRPNVVEGDVLGPRHVQAGELAHLRGEHRLGVHLRLDALPLRERVNFQGVLVGDDEPVGVLPELGQGFPEPGRDAEAPFRVDRVLVAASKHGL